MGIQGVCRNVSISIVGGAVFCKRLHMVENCFLDFPWMGSRTIPLEGIVDEVAMAIATAYDPLLSLIDMGAGDGA